MTKVSVNQVWDETLAFVRAERRLLIPLALATLYLAGVVATLAAEAYRASGGRSGGASIVIILVSLWSILGQLAISRMALFGGVSVGEALGTSARLLPRLIGLFVLLGAVLAIPFLVLGYVAMQAGYDPLVPATIALVPGWVGLVGLVLMVATVWVFLRLSLATPAVAAGSLGPIEAARASFALTRGLVWRLIGLGLLYFVLWLVLRSAVVFVLGGLLALLLPHGGLWSALSVLTALLAALVPAVLATIATVFLARLYARTNSGT